MHGGAITGIIYGSNGGGVCNAGVFTLRGGVISNNTTNGSGGGVVNLNVFLFYGGEITGNNAPRNPDISR